ncbi:MAG: DUF4159 domain-containing protein [Rhodospirillales bacterium]|nr:DUF4159 domain-containing protein [Rhodospirillales bacterium]
MIGGLPGTLAFLNPWALTALLGLPVIYILLRITPPAPRTIAFPAVRLLAGLEPKEHTPSHTPWWILLLRLLMAALLLLALARPVLNPAPASAVDGPLVLVIDNGWGAAQSWDDIQDTALHEITQAGRQGQNITLLTTAAQSDIQGPQVHGPLTMSDALAFVRALKPAPWESSLGALRATLPDVRNARVIWLSDGLEKPGHAALARTLEGMGSLSLYMPVPEALPLSLKAPERFRAHPAIVLDGPHNLSSQAPVRVQLLGAAGKILDDRLVETAGRSFPIEVEFDLPQVQQAHAGSFRIAAQNTAGARYFLDGLGGPKSVAIIAPEEASQSARLTEDSFYLVKALEPYATILQGELSDVFAQNPSMMILPDVGVIPPDLLNDLSTWVEGGGVLLRFAGPTMVQAHGIDSLTPVALRREARNVKGSLSWDRPLSVQPIAPASPLYGLTPDEDLRISGQILPEFSSDLGDKIWVTLEDGTPLITADQRGAGLVVMVHTTASPEWSNLPLSGFYVQMLKRLLQFSGAGASTPSLDQNGLLQPVQVLDGFGALQSPGAQVLPIDAAAFDEQIPDAAHPPGFYGRSGLQKALNLGDHLPTPRAITASEGASLKTYGRKFEKDLVPALLCAAFMLFLLDALIMLFLSGAKWPRPSLKKTSLVALCILSLFGALPAQAQTPEAAQELTLAYIRTGNVSIDAISQKGLEVLAAALNMRTSAEPKYVRGVSPESDTLVFYPLLYWPISAAQNPPSPQALANLQAYLDHGGTILVDTRDGKSSSEVLRRTLANLNIPPLTPLTEEHVLNKSFYLLKNRFPGRYDGATLWVEGQSAGGRDGVSPVILGSHDWASGWAELSLVTRGEQHYLSGMTPRHEQSLRFGVNLVMYALTGNYKADQVHVPHILERLGRGNRGGP